MARLFGILTYSRVERLSVRLYGEWMPQAGFINGMPVKVRVMRDCIVITPQHTHGLFVCIEGMGVTRINKRSAEQWLKKFLGALNNTGDIPVIKRKRTEQELMSN
ncbi:SymE family type I addiction module toxin [Salmonella enterica]|uniref:Type I toxin-antitoxin system SymE family toxin n=1 Tax=Salmonella enterica TaxID=28901 RepID=A0A741D0L7_SALER|nr:SymE family type I addiction module toxin [Salmonella enterica]EHD6547428.1 type I toxin-antitoxin system SymE family toxin [Salmonella enterica subsp. enterica serovar Enteritidis]EHN8489511.1 type I toxin-antitoxin system SymE family toxin [Salmonella enterica subsp. enterica serovar Enteritidis]HAB6678416.1 type I toxin-antitoxin system SymE family toxin [Salmonella enterica]HAE3102090.1 type I toxin-antitoxin system SymE family toxin [Salmonella enterica]HAE6646846.1 type I toxin-antito